MSKDELCRELNKRLKEMVSDEANAPREYERLQKLMLKIQADFPSNKVDIATIDRIISQEKVHHEIVKEIQRYFVSRCEGLGIKLSEPDMVMGKKFMFEGKLF